jgi:hypothetical protein
MVKPPGTRERLIRSSPAQFVILLCGLLTVFAVGAVTIGPWWWDMYAVEYGLPRMGERWGFEVGKIPFQRDGVSYEWTGIVRLAPDGKLATFGVRLHDAPFEYHGHGSFVFHDALRAVERGEDASLDVINVDDFAAGRPAHRTIQLKP